MISITPLQRLVQQLANGRGLPRSSPADQFEMLGLVTKRHGDAGQRQHCIPMLTLEPRCLLASLVGECAPQTWSFSDLESLPSGE